MSEHVETRMEDGVLRIAFNRPEKKNALTHAMYAATADALEAAAADTSVRVVLFEARGEAFTAGNDLGDFLNTSLGDGAGETPPVERFLLAIATAEKPLIAAVNGVAVGVGVTMLLHCDLVFAAEGATFQTPFVNLALSPEAASSLLLPRLAGHQRAAELLLLGRRISAARACEMGIVNEVAPVGELAPRALAAAGELAGRAPEALRLSKRLMKGDPAERLRRMEEEGRHFAERLRSAEFREAATAFLEKRKPDFSKFG